MIKLLHSANYDSAEPSGTCKAGRCKCDRYPDEPPAAEPVQQE
ncbi:hypothetical protein ACE1CB_02950 [Aerosakkonema sp. BLCC-F2]